MKIVKPGLDSEVKEKYEIGHQTSWAYCNS